MRSCARPCRCIGASHARRFRSDKPPRISKWIKQDVALVIVRTFGGIEGFRLWKILVEHTFARFDNDEDADESSSPTVTAPHMAAADKSLTSSIV